jgi:hypothetical protein
MKKEIKLTYLKKAVKFLKKHKNSISEEEIVIESIIEDIDFRGNIYK